MGLSLRRAPWAFSLVVVAAGPRSSSSFPYTDPMIPLVFPFDQSLIFAENKKKKKYKLGEEVLKECM